MSDRELFLAALDLPSADRLRFLAEQCPEDPARLARVAKLLAAHEAAGNFLEQPIDPGPTANLPQSRQTGVEATTDTAGDREASVTADHDAEPDAGVVIAGKYKLLQQIGEGGMGTVWMADQTEPVKRRVAVKLIRVERGRSATILARFEAERQAIALMDHPHIAKLLDAGTEAGRPFFVMELVKGVPLTEYCDQHKLSVGDRLNLFMQICSAVQHAHQKGIIHRDLKPSNVLVESHDGKPVPRVIDFGLAKATSGMQLTEHTLFTGFGSVMGTPLYMAPEQATFNAVDIDTRADIYALGVILYELLTGTTPIDKARLRKVALEEVLRVIREEDAPTPSSRLSSSDAKPSIAADRQTEPAKLGRFVRGELDWIVMKALSKDRDRRYETANGFARDVERFLNHEPVVAGPPSARYRLRKFVQRNRGAVLLSGGALIVLLGLVGVLVIGIVQRDNANRRYEAALQKESDARKRTRTALDALTSDTLQEWFAQQTSISLEQRDVLRQLLGHYEAFAGEEGNDRDTQLGRIHAHIRIGRIQRLLGDQAAAGDAYRRAVELAGTAAAPAIDDPDGWAAVADAHWELAQLDADNQRFPIAERYNREALAAAIRLRDARPDRDSRERVCRVRLNLIAALGGQSRFDDADAESKTVEAEVRHLAEDYRGVPDYSRMLSLIATNRAGRNASRGRPDRAEPDHNQAIRLARQYCKEKPGDRVGWDWLATTISDYARFLGEQSRLGDAESVRREAVSIWARLADSYPSVLLYRRHVATACIAQGLSLNHLGRYPDARDQLRRAVVVIQQLTDEFKDDLSSGLLLADCLAHLCHTERHLISPVAAERTALDALAETERLVAIHGRLDTITRARQYALGLLVDALNDQGKVHAALAATRESLTLAAALAAAHPQDVRLASAHRRKQIALAQALSNTGELKEAEELLRSVCEKSQGEPFDEVRAEAVLELAHVLARSERWEDSEQWADRAVGEYLVRHRQNSKYVRNRESLVISYWRRATARDRLKRHATAAADWGEAAKLDDVPMNRAFYRAHSGSSLARGGDAKSAAPEFAAAIREAADALKAENLNGIVYYDGAAVYALAAGSTADPTAAEKYAAEAVRLLGLAAKVGFLNDPAQRKTLRAADEYTALHSRADFQKLLADLDAKFPPPPVKK